jgi:hypothetical protein
MTKRCFVIGPIGPRASDIRVAADHFIKYIVGPCIEDLKLGFSKPDRADQLPEPGRITSQVVELLKKADLVIADLTGYNANVYYELSLRHAIGLPTVHMAAEGTALPFDLAGERVIPYTMHVSDVDRAKEDLEAQIRRVLEPGYKPRNPILDAIGLISLERSTEPAQQALATLTHDVQNLRGDIATLKSLIVPVSTPTVQNASGHLVSMSALAGLGFEQRSNLLIDPSTTFRGRTGPTGPGRRAKQSENEGNEP